MEVSHQVRVLFVLWNLNAEFFYYFMQNKTNQIVPEVTVDLKGATICWATKDKSSKKNVLEVCRRIKLQIQEGSHLFWTQTQFLST